MLIYDRDRGTAAIERSEELRILVMSARGNTETTVQRCRSDRARRSLERCEPQVDYRAEVAALKIEIDGLHTAMLTRAVIEQAKGMLMLREKCTADEAFDTLRKTSQKSNVRISDIAVWLVNSISSPPARTKTH